MSKNYYGAGTIRGDDEIIVAGFDTETRGLGGELLSIQWGIFGKVHVDTSENMIENFLNFIMDYPAPVIWYCHFAQYDWRYFMSAFVEMGIDVQCFMRSDSAMYQITLKNKNGKKVIMRDSFAIWGSSLKELAQSFCPEMPKLEIDILNFDPQNPEHIEYARRDVMILLVALPRLFSMMAKLFDVNPNGTFASTSMKAWQKTLGDKTFSASRYNEREEFIRSAYFGGLVFLTTTEIQKDATTYDLNSCYPWVMCEYGVPDGRVFVTTEFKSDKMGIYKCRVKSPEDLVIPILPARNANGAMRWYRGEFVTTITNQEMIFAANNGYEILEVYEGIYWESVAFPFNDFIEKCKSVRFAFRGKPEEVLAKFFQNSLYGKYGSRRERLRVIAAHSADEKDLIGVEPYGDDGHWYIKKEFDDEMRCKPEWAVFITAHARLRLLQSAYSVGVENVFYGDTDSLTIRSGCESPLDVGMEYGQWKKEKEWTHFRPIAPKVYSGKLKGGKMYAAAKGLPKNDRNEKGHRVYHEHEMQELFETGITTASVNSLDSLRVTLKKGVRSATTLRRKSTDLEKSLNYERLTDGRVRPKMAA